MSADRAGAGLPVTQWTMRPDNVCLIAQVTVTLIWRPRNASAKDNGLEMTVLKVKSLFSFFRYRILRFLGLILRQGQLQILQTDF